MAGIGFWMVGVALCVALVPIYIALPWWAVVACLTAVATLVFLGAAVLLATWSDRRRGKRS